MLDRYRGSLLALALADAIGAKYEGGFGERLLWNALGVTKPGVLRWTDDTQMALGLAESLVEQGGFDADALAQRWARDATWTRGYGRGAMALLQRVSEGTPWREANRSVFPVGSFGNGAAMRAAPLGLYFHRDESALLEAARLAAEITHAHPHGIEGGVLIAHATALAVTDRFDWAALEAVCRHDEYRSRIALARDLGEATPREVRESLGNSIIAHESAVTAVYLFTRFREQSCESLLEFVLALGGDTDTIGAMAGGIWGAARGVDALPADALERVEERERIDAAAQALFRNSPGSA